MTFSQLFAMAGGANDPLPAAPAALRLRMKCPICSTVAVARHADTPYWKCPGCGVWFQSPMPPKKWHGDHEHWLGKPMEDPEKKANADLAAWLFDDLLKGKPGRVTDVGASYPYLLKCLIDRGCTYVALDGWPMKNDLGIEVEGFDFDIDPLPAAGQQLITFVHTFEHIYDPLGAMHRLRAMIADDGVLFIRMPDNMVEGIERDLFPSMYEIHPFVHSLSSIAELCARTNTFVIERAPPVVPGQRDLTLRPI